MRAILLLAVVSGLAATASAEAEEACGAEDVALMQLGSRVARGARTAVDRPARVGRSFLSLDPVASALFFANYFVGAEVVSLPSCAGAERAAVELDIWPKTGGFKRPALFVFNKAQEGQLPEGLSTATEIIDVMRQGWLDKIDAKIPGFVYDLNHEAFAKELFLFENALADGVVDMGFDMTNLLVYVPHTLWMVEIMNMDDEAAAHPELVLQPNEKPEGVVCINSSAPAVEYVGQWPKSTTLAADPEAAATFVIDLLGAEKMQSAFVWPPVPDCLAMQWVKFADGYMIHFAQDNNPERSARIQTVVDSAEASAKAANGGASPFAYDSLIFAVKNLQAAEQTLTRKGWPFTPVATSAGDKQAIVTRIPGTALSLQVTGTGLDAGTTLLSDPCAAVA